MTFRRAIALLLLVCVGGLFSLAADNRTPAPYSPDEFPGWALDLRRGEIVAIGVFPISLLASRLLYDVVRFGYQSARSGEFRQDYAPWFFAPPDAPALTDGERVGILLGAVGISITIALVDFWLGRREEARARR